MNQHVQLQVAQRLWGRIESAYGIESKPAIDVKRYWITYSATRQASPMSYNVLMPSSHRVAEGYPMLWVEIDDFTFRFASVHEVQHMIDVFRPLMLPRRHVWPDGSVSEFRNQNSHWLSRLPAEVKARKFRLKTIEYLEEILPEVKPLMPVDQAV